jgi:ABC-type nickel/cobalt efflux system permease component RcnA
MPMSPTPQAVFTRRLLVIAVLTALFFRSAWSSASNGCEQYLAVQASALLFGLFAFVFWRKYRRSQGDEWRVDKWVLPLFFPTIWKDR